MIIIKIIGGLGNQMFQYSLYKSLDIKSSDNIKIDTSEFSSYKLHNGYMLDEIFNIDDKIIANKKELDKLKDTYPLFKYRKKINLIKRTHYLEKKPFSLDTNIFDFKKKYLDGYWQSYKYFEDIKDELNRDFKFNINLSDMNKNIIHEIKSSNSCSIHVRRGDYVNHPSFKNICDKKYYKKAINKIKSLNRHNKFFVFSNDPKWCKENFEEDNIVFVDWNKGSNSFIDMFLMSKCKNNIIANSSFSWWGSWLNNNENKVVISPNIWANNIENETIIPEEWLKIN